MASSGPGQPPSDATQVSSQPRRLKTPPNYRRSTAGESTSETLARDIVQRRIMLNENSRILGGNYRNGRWFDAAGNYIGSAKTERSAINFVRPRKLGQRGQS